MAVVFLAAAALGTAPAAESCFDLGFTSSLLCSGCDALAKHVKDDALQADCKKCCTPDATSGAGSFNSATLRICK